MSKRPPNGTISIGFQHIGPIDLSNIPADYREEEEWRRLELAQLGEDVKHLVDAVDRGDVETAFHTPLD